MLKDSQALAAIALIMRQFPYRRVAEALGISLSSVKRIAKGKWRPRRKTTATENEEIAEKIRCPGCGANVVGPCVRCATIDEIEKAGLNRMPDVFGDSLKIELRGPEGQRYQALSVEKFLQAWCGHAIGAVSDEALFRTRETLHSLAGDPPDCDTPADVPVFESIDDPQILAQLGEVESEDSDA